MQLSRRWKIDLTPLRKVIPSGVRTVYECGTRSRWSWKDNRDWSSFNEPHYISEWLLMHMIYAAYMIHVIASSEVGGEQPSRNIKAEVNKCTFKENSIKLNQMDGPFDTCRITATLEEAQWLWIALLKGDLQDHETVMSTNRNWILHLQTQIYIKTFQGVPQLHKWISKSNTH